MAGDSDKSLSSVFVKGLPFSANQEELEAIFEDIGPVRVARIVRDTRTGDSKGFGFVRFAVPGDAEKAAAEWNGKSYAGRKLLVERALKRGVKYSGDGSSSAQAQPAASAGDLESRPGPPVKHRNLDTLPIPGPKLATTLLVWGLPHDVDMKRLRQRLRKAALTGGLAKRVMAAAKEGSSKAEEGGLVQLAGVSVMQAPHGGISPVLELEEVPTMPYTTNHPGVEPGTASRKAAPPTVFAITFTDRHFVDRALAALEGKALLGASVTLRRAGAVLPRVPARRKARLIVRNLPWAAGHMDLYNTFVAVGPVAQVHMPRRKPKAGSEAAAAAHGRREGHKGQHAGYAFVQYYTHADAVTAVAKLNEVKVLDRPVAVDWATPREREEAAGAGAEAGSAASRSSGEGSGSDSDSDSSATGSGSGTDSSDSDSGSDSDSDSDSDSQGTPASDEESDAGSVASDSAGGDAGPEAAPAPAVAELSLTVFIRNISFDTKEDALYEALRVFGPLRYVVIVKDRATGLSKGTAFAAFKYAASAAAVVLASHKGKDPTAHVASTGVTVAAWSAEAVMASAPEAIRTKLMAAVAKALPEGGLTVDSRPLSIFPAVDKASSTMLAEDHAAGGGKAFDKRHLYLSKEGRITGGDAGAVDVPRGDMAKRDAAARDAKVKLASPLFFVSPTKLSMRNMAKWMTDADLRKLASKAAARGMAAGLVTHQEGDPALWLPEWKAAGGAAATPPATRVKVVKVKVFREAVGALSTGGKVKLQNAKSKQARAINRGSLPVQSVALTGVSKGFGFVEFAEHIHALAALRELNNNPAYGTYAAGGKASMKVPEEKRARPIVSFAVENKAKLMVQEKRRAAAEKTRAKIAATYGDDAPGSGKSGKGGASQQDAAPAKPAQEPPDTPAPEPLTAEEEAAAAAKAEKKRAKKERQKARKAAEAAAAAEAGAAEDATPAPAPAQASQKAAQREAEPVEAVVPAAAPGTEKKGTKRSRASSEDEVLFFDGSGALEQGTSYSDDESVASFGEGGADADELQALLSAAKAANPFEEGGEAAAPVAAKPARGKAGKGGKARATATAEAAAAALRGRPVGGAKRGRGPGGPGGMSKGAAASEARGAKFRKVRERREGKAGKGGKSRFAASDKLDGIIAARQAKRSRR